MQQGQQQNSQTIISMEEYLNKRQAIREEEQKKEQKKANRAQAKSPALSYAELYI